MLTDIDLLKMYESLKDIDETGDLSLEEYYKSYPVLTEIPLRMALTFLLINEIDQVTNDTLGHLTNILTVAKIDDDRINKLMVQYGLSKD